MKDGLKFLIILMQILIIYLLIVSREGFKKTITKPTAVKPACVLPSEPPPPNKQYVIEVDGDCRYATCPINPVGTATSIDRSCMKDCIKSTAKANCPSGRNDKRKTSKGTFYCCNGPHP
jgi:hypothetical protein